MLWTEGFRVKTLLVPYHHAEPLPTLGQAYPADDAAVVSKGPAGAMVARLYDLVAGRVAASSDPLAVVSGDCTTSLAIVAGLQRRGLSPGVIWLDAHADFHTPRTTRSGYLGGMAARDARGARRRRSRPRTSACSASRTSRRRNCRRRLGTFTSMST